MIAINSNDSNSSNSRNSSNDSNNSNNCHSSNTSNRAPPEPPLSFGRRRNRNPRAQPHKFSKLVFLIEDNLVILHVSKLVI